MKLFFVFIVIAMIFSSVICQEKDLSKTIKKDEPTKWSASFSQNSLKISMEEKHHFNLTISDLDMIDSFRTAELEFQLKVENTHLARVENFLIKPKLGSKFWQHNFTVIGNFLGSTNVYLELINSNGKNEVYQDKIQLIIIRKMRIIDHVFTGSVALLVSLLYINFGAALDFTVMKDILRRPIGPIIGFVGQFIVMPLLSYVIGLIIFPDLVEFRLGLFFTGISPGGGASNMWTVILHGNINLSIIMTTISTFAAFAMIPCWTFTLGKEIFHSGNLGVPYKNISTFAIALIIPLFIGFGIQKFFPKTTKVLVRLLKPISVILILFIVIFAIATNLYLFELFSWQIVIAGLCLPWLGYVLSYIVAILCKQSFPDALTIAIETGIQNTGIAIFLLRFGLEQPYADLTTVIPVSVALMTPVPLFILYISQKCMQIRRSNITSETQSIIRRSNETESNNA